MKALNNYVFLKRDKTPEKIGSIVLPESAQEIPAVGEVVSIGPNHQLDLWGDGEHLVKEADRVIYKRYSASEIIIDNEEFVVVEDKDILCVL